MKQPIDIKTPYMTLGQLLKETAIIGSGGQAKWFLKETTVLVNGEPDDRRGRKLYPG
ncbi:S4 domain-containing protein YaaA, partial [Lactiplantibacillus plantarum]